MIVSDLYKIFPYVRHFHYLRYIVTEWRWGFVRRHRPSRVFLCQQLAGKDKIDFGLQKNGSTIWNQTCYKSEKHWQYQYYVSVEPDVGWV